MHPSMTARLAAEFIGTFVLVLGGCGAAVLDASFMSDNVNMGIAFAGVALAFGLCVMGMAYAVGPISGGHFNPAVSLGCAVAGRLEWKALIPYWVAQIVGASAGGAVLLLIASGKEGFDPVASGFATTGYGEFSPGGYGLIPVLITECVFTAIFLTVILGSTDRLAPKGFAPIAIGLTLTMIILVTIPVSNCSVNPARSLGVAWFAGAARLSQQWVFFVAPLAGAAIAGAIYKFMVTKFDFPEPEEVDAE